MQTSRVRSADTWETHQRQEGPARSRGSSAGEELRCAGTRNPTDENLHSSAMAALPEHEGLQLQVEAVSRQQER